MLRKLGKSTAHYINTPSHIFFHCSGYFCFVGGSVEIWCSSRFCSWPPLILLIHIAFWHVLQNQDYSNSFADDALLYLTLKPTDTSNLANHRTCLFDIKSWIFKMLVMMLKWCLRSFCSASQTSSTQGFSFLGTNTCFHIVLAWLL